jgi:RND family efflux transporter MFP subunit
VEREVAGVQSFVGTLVPVRTSNVGSAVDGRVIDFPVNEGERVNKGDVLAQLLTGQLDIQLAGAEAELKLRKKALEELENGTRPEEKAQAKARYQARQAAWDFAKGRLERANKLLPRGSITEDQFQEITSLATQAEQLYYEAKNAWELAEKGPRDEVIAQAAARVAVQEEEVNAIKDQLAKHTIRAPFDGYLVKEHTEIGQWVVKGGLVATVAELDQVDVEIMVLENYYPALRLGLPATVETPAFPGRRFDAEVAVIVPQADARSRNIPVKVRMPNQFDGNRPVFSAGMFARVSLPVAATGRTTMVPKDAVVLGGPSPIVYVVDIDPKNNKEGTARIVPVELGAAEGSLIAVKGPLKAGDKVVVEGNERLFPNSKVTIARELPVETAPAASARRTGSAGGLSKATTDGRG